LYRMCRRLRIDLRGQPTNRKGKPDTGQEHVGKGANWKAVYQSVSPETWMIWIRPLVTS
jgi:hypothetical protein